MSQKIEGETGYQPSHPQRIKRWPLTGRPRPHKLHDSCHGFNLLGVSVRQAEPAASALVTWDEAVHQIGEYHRMTREQK